MFEKAFWNIETHYEAQNILPIFMNVFMKLVNLQKPNKCKRMSIQPPSVRLKKHTQELPH